MPLGRQRWGRSGEDTTLEAPPHRMSQNEDGIGQATGAPGSHPCKSVCLEPGPGKALPASLDQTPPLTADPLTRSVPSLLPPTGLGTQPSVAAGLAGGTVGVGDGAGAGT